MTNVKSNKNFKKEGYKVDISDYGFPTGSKRKAICPCCQQEYEYYDSYVKYIVNVKRLGINVRLCSYNCKYEFLRKNKIDLKEERLNDEFKKESYLLGKNKKGKCDLC